jgi:hypothetical protein
MERGSLRMRPHPFSLFINHASLRQVVQQLHDRRRIFYLRPLALVRTQSVGNSEPCLQRNPLGDSKPEQTPEISVRPIEVDHSLTKADTISCIN